MSQKSTPDIEPILTILRVAIGDQFPILWSPDLTPEKLELQNILTMIKVEGNLNSDSTQLVNRLRALAMTEAMSSWIWMIDSDVMLTKDAIDAVKRLIQSGSLTGYGLAGGLYKSNRQQPFIEKSYNRLCSIWSTARNLPLAGNMLVSKKILVGDFDLDKVKFGQEEYYLSQKSLECGLKVGVFDFPLIHLNNKNLLSLIKRCLSQANAGSKRTRIPWKNYFREIVKSLKEAPYQTLVVMAYLLVNFIFARALIFFQEVLNMKYLLNERSLQSPRPLRDRD